VSGLGIVPSITYDQSWNRPEGFLLSEVIEVAQKKEDEEAEKLIDKYLGQFNDGNTRASSSLSPIYIIQQFLNILVFRKQKFLF